MTCHRCRNLIIFETLATAFLIGALLTAVMFLLDRHDERVTRVVYQEIPMSEVTHD